MHVLPIVPRKPILLLAGALFVLELSAATRTDRYALILADPPLAELAGSREQLESEAMAQPRARIESIQTNLKAELEIRHLHEKIDHLLRGQYNRLFEIQQIQIELLEEISQRKRGSPREQPLPPANSPA